MQLIAREGSNRVAASAAEKGKDYLCLECNTPVRLRKGPHKQAHFFHISSSRKCKQSQKSQEHLQLQIQLLKCFGAQGAMECAFEKIGRIADVAWHEKKIIFEIQCSPITAEEAIQRTQDYRTVGYQVIWILHDKRFNQKKLSHAEVELRKFPCYYTDVDENGRGIIYDQFEIIHDHIRRFKGPKLPVHPHAIFPLTTLSEKAPLALMSRRENWKLFCSGDLYDHFRKGKSSEQMVFVETVYSRQSKTKKRLKSLSILFRYYRFFLHALLLRNCPEENSKTPRA